jgi:thiol:disulfide interchange protein
VLSQSIDGPSRLLRAWAAAGQILLAASRAAAAACSASLPSGSFSITAEALENPAFAAYSTCKNGARFGYNFHATRLSGRGFNVPSGIAMKRTLFPAAVAVLLAANSVGAQPGNPFAVKKPGRFTFADLAQVTVEVTPKEAKPGETVQVKLTVAPKPGNWTYPVKPKDRDQIGTNRIEWKPVPADLIFVGDIQDPPNAKTKASEDDPGKLKEYYPNAVTWVLSAVVSPKATPGPKKVPLTGSSVQVCGKLPNGNDVCLNTSPKEMPAAEFTVLDTPPVPIEPKYAPVVDQLLGSGPAPALPPPGSGGKIETHGKPEPADGSRADSIHKKAFLPADQYRQQLNAIAAKIDVDESDTSNAKKTGLFAFLITAATWGLVSLVTPCVFPMIPITVSIFLKQSHQSRLETMKLASIYCLTIILVLGISAIALLKVFVALSVNPWMNLFLGGLFVFFALSLFGMYDITLPNSLLKFTRTKQGAGGVVGTIFGALAFTIVSFTCVAPFLGGFAGMAASGSFTQLQLVLGGLAFATAFAFPFFLLALFPGLLKALPRSGGWLDSVKVVMGFLEIAAALKFLRTAEIGWESPTSYFTYDLVLGGWVAILFATGLYLLNAYRLPHDEEKANIGVPRLLFALTFLGLGIYLAPALLKGADGKSQRPSGVAFAWVDAFLLPEAAGDFGVDLQSAMDRAKAGNKLVFIDFTGDQCTNCRYNEKNVFPTPQVANWMGQYEKVQLDAQFEVPASAYIEPPSREARAAESLANRDFKEKLFRNEQLPLYVILIPQADGKWKARTYDEGKINDTEAFKKFLQDGLLRK